MSKKMYIILGCIIVGIILGAAVFGILKKDEYENPMDDFEGVMVCQFYDELRSLIDEEGGILNTYMNDSKYILKVSPVSEAEFDFQTYSSDVKIEKIFRSEGDLEVGDTIKISIENFTFYADDKTMSLGFANFMKPDNEYLVFLHDKLETEIYDYPVYRTEGFSIAPIFNYKDLDNVIIEEGKVIGNGTYCYYNDVKDNEFFVVSKDLEEEFRNFKYRVISTVDDEYVIPEK